MSQSGFMEERGLNFEGISVDKLVDFLAHTCKNRLYKVDEFTIEDGKILYLAGDAVGEKAYYLLTAVVKEYEGLTQVLLRVNSDKIHGLNGFLNETLDNLRHLVVSTSAREIGIIKKEQVINIIDSVVQRSTISMEDGAPEIKIRDSMVQRTNILSRNEVGKKDKEDFGRSEKDKKIERSVEHQRTTSNSIGMEFVLIPAGEFDMGSPSNEAGRWDYEGQIHRVRIANAFYMGKYEVTQKQWRDVMGNNPSYFKGDNLPVEQFHGTMFRNSLKNSMKKKVRTSTIFHQKQNGNMQRGQRQQRDILLAMMNQNLMIMLGTNQTQGAKPTRSVRKSPILGDFMTCMAMSGNGFRIYGMAAILAHPQTGVHGKEMTRPASIVAVAGTLRRPRLSVGGSRLLPPWRPPQHSRLSPSEGFVAAFHFAPLPLTTKLSFLRNLRQCVRDPHSRSGKRRKKL